MARSGDSASGLLLRRRERNRAEVARRSRGFRHRSFSSRVTALITRAEFREGVALAAEILEPEGHNPTPSRAPACRNRGPGGNEVATKWLRTRKTQTNAYESRSASGARKQRQAERLVSTWMKADESVLNHPIRRWSCFQGRGTGSSPVGATTERSPRNQAGRRISLTESSSSGIRKGFATN